MSFPLLEDLAELDPSLVTHLAWDEIQVITPTDDDEAVSDPTALPRTTLYLKLVIPPEQDSYCLLLTDLVHVWFRRADQHELERERKMYAASIKRPSPAHLLQMISDLLTSKTQAHMDTHTYVLEDRAKDMSSLTLHASHRLSSAFSLSWKFVCSSYGSPQDQALFLKQQMYQPLIQMVKCLAYHVKNGRSSPSTKPRSVAPPSSSYGSSQASQHHSSYVPPPTTTTGAHDAVAVSFPTDSREYDTFSLSYSFKNTVGELYIGAMNILSQEMERDRDRERDKDKRQHSSSSHSHSHRRPLTTTATHASSPSASAAPRSPDSRSSHIRDTRSPRRDEPSRSPRRDDMMERKYAAPVPPPPSSSSDRPSSSPSDTTIGRIDAHGNYVETEEERKRRQALAAQLEAEKANKAKKKRKTFV